MLRIAMAAFAVLLLAGCQPSETVCALAEEAKFTFDDFARDGEFSPNTVTYVNAVYDEGIKVCTAPPGTYDQVTIIRTAGSVLRVLRSATRESEAASVAMYPQIRNLERALDAARQLE